MTMLGSVAALFLKRASGFESIKMLLMDINLYIGAGLYLTSALLNIYILKYLDYSIVLPLTSITYIWTILVSYWILKEKITPRKIIGVTAIFISSVLLSFN